MTFYISSDMIRLLTVPRLARGTSSSCFDKKPFSFRVNRRFPLMMYYTAGGIALICVFIIQVSGTNTLIEIMWLICRVLNTRTSTIAVANVISMNTTTATWITVNWYDRKVFPFLYLFSR